MDDLSVGERRNPDKRTHDVNAASTLVPALAADRQGVTRIMADLPPVIFGDGNQTRDFTWVEETPAGIIAATCSDELVGDSVNIAFGNGISINRISELLLKILGANGLEPEYREPRPGDVEHHYADTAKAREVLGFEATMPIEEGLERYVDWVRRQEDGVALGRADVARNW